MSVQVKKRNYHEDPFIEEQTNSDEIKRIKLQRASLDHLRAIVASKKAYGPVDEKALVDYLNEHSEKPKVGLNNTIVSQNKAIAIGLGLPTYRGMACKICGGNERIVTNSQCSNCEPSAVKARFDVRRREKGQGIINDMCLAYGFSREQIIGHSHEAELVACRHDIWLALYGIGMGFSEIARMFNRDHTSVRSAIRKLTQKQARQLINRTHPVQPGELWG